MHEDEFATPPCANSSSGSHTLTREEDTKREISGEEASFEDDLRHPMKRVNAKSTSELRRRIDEKRNLYEKIEKVRSESSLRNLPRVPEKIAEAHSSGILITFYSFFRGRGGRTDEC